jgi:PilZ domain
MTGKRKDKRFQLRSCRIQIDKLSFFGLRTKSLGKVVLVNLSVSGLQALATTEMNPGDKFTIKIITNTFPPMDIESKVMWSKLQKGKNFEKFYRTGFSFIKITNHYRDNLRKLEADPMLREVTRSII